MQPHPLENFLEQNLCKFERNLDEFGRIWATVIKIWANLIRFGQNQKSCIPRNIRSPMAMVSTLEYLDK